jgi:acid stress-induced BolA-like protein IbaG/YrbA
MLPHEVKARIEDGLPVDFIEVQEFSGGTDHYSVIIVSEAFSGVPLLRRHRMVMELFRAELATEDVHALTIKAYTRQQWETEKSKPRLF